MTTTTSNHMLGPLSVRDLIRINDALKREDRMRSRLQRVRVALAGLVDNIQESEQIRYTGWVVLLKRDGEGWKYVSIVNPNTDEGRSMPTEFDMVLPIPDPTTITEFQGW